MKYLLTLAGLYLLSGCAQMDAENGFEGSIRYHFSDFVLLDSASRETIDAVKSGGDQTTWFKAGSMMTRSNGPFLEELFFDRPDNIAYAKLKDSDTLWAIRGDKNFASEDQLLSIIPVDGTDTVLGHVCKRIKLSTVQQEVIFSYSPDFPANPAHFEKTKYSHYREVYKHIKSYFLMCRLTIRGQYSYSQTAIAIHPGTVPDSTFPDVSKLPIKWVN